MKHADLIHSIDAVGADIYARMVAQEVLFRAQADMHEPLHRDYLRSLADEAIEAAGVWFNKREEALG